MKLKNTKSIAIALIVLLAAPVALAGANSPVQEKPIKNIYNDKGQLIGQTRNEIPAPVADSGYKVFEHSHKTDTLEVYYPQLDYPNMITAVLANYQLIQAPGNYMTNIAPSAKLTMDYTLTRQDENLISVAFRGEQVQKDSTEPILTSVNYNLKTRIIITAKRLIQDTDEARQGVSRLLQQAARTNPAAITPPAYSDQMNFFLTGRYIVFYYPGTDPTAKYVELPVAIDLIRPYFTEEYRTLAVTSEVSKDPRQVITDIESSLAGYQSVSGKRTEGELSADFTAYFNNDQLVYIEEKQTKGEYESSTAKYYFDGGKLIAYTKNGQNLIIPLGGVATVQREEVSMFYDAALNLADGELKINGAATKLPESYIKTTYITAEAIRSQAAELLKTTKK